MKCSMKNYKESLKFYIIIIILILFLSLIYINPVYAKIYVIKDTEGNIVCINNSGTLGTEYAELGYTIELLFERARSPEYEENIEKERIEKEKREEELAKKQEEEKALKKIEEQIKKTEEQIKELERIEKLRKATEVKIIDSTDYISESGNYHYFEGVLKNNGKVTTKWVKVKIFLKNKYDKLVSLETSYSDPIHLSPNQEGTYSIIAYNNPDVAKYEIQVLWEY